VQQKQNEKKDISWASPTFWHPSMSCSSLVQRVESTGHAPEEVRPRLHCRTTSTLRKETRRSGTRCDGTQIKPWPLQHPHPLPAAVEGTDKHSPRIFGSPHSKCFPTLRCSLAGVLARQIWVAVLKAAWGADVACRNRLPTCSIGRSPPTGACGSSCKSFPLGSVRLALARVRGSLGRRR
jgi:hypothetical protein